LPHRDTHLSHDSHTLILTLLETNNRASITLRTFDRTWPGTPTKAEIWSITKRADTIPLHPDNITPNSAMWKCLYDDYTPSNHPSHIICTPPDGNKPPPAILAAIDANNHLVFSTIIRLSVAHCFDTDYSDRFRPSARDRTICPCEHRPCRRTRQCHHIQFCHTQNHVIFNCHLTAPYCQKYPIGHTSLKGILSSYTTTAQLCQQLVESNSTLFRPLPLPPPLQGEESRPDPWPDP
jgi:hypothetical protein